MLETNQADGYQAAFPSELGPARVDRYVVTEPMEGLGDGTVLVWDGLWLSPHHVVSLCAQDSPLLPL